MEYLILSLIFIISMIVGYYIQKIQISLHWRILINLFSLIICGLLLFITRIKETSLLVYILLVLFTFSGLLVRLVVPVVLNILEKILAHIKKDTYEPQTYDELMKSGHKMYFCVLTFTTIKVMLYVLLFASFLNLL